MTESTLKFAGGDFVRAVLLVATAVVGIVLPFDFLSQIDANLIYLRPWELLPVWGWSWVFYAFFGLVAGVFAAFSSIGVSLMSRTERSYMMSAFARWLSFSIVALALIRAVKLWLPSQGFSATTFWMSRNQDWIVVIILIGSCIRASRLFHKPLVLNKIPVICSLAGLILSLLAPFASPAKNSSAPATWSAPIEMATREKSPDIILLTVDALTANHLSLYNYARPTTPNLLALASGADVFDRFYANGNFTTPATNSFINGVLPWIHRANQAMAQVDPEIADRGLIARLKRSGYETLAVATNPFAAPFHNGNDRWLDAAVYDRTHVSFLILMSRFGTRFPHMLPTVNLSIIISSCNLIDRCLVFARIWTPTDQYDPELAFSAARRLIQERDNRRPIFLWVHILSPHSPYASPSPFAGRFDTSLEHRSRFDSTPPSGFLATDSNRPLTQYIGRYDEAIACTDYHIGKFLEWLKQHSLYEKALIVVSADHGESFTHHFGGHAGPELYDDVIHIPLLIKEPGQIIGKRYSSLAQQIDLMPTLLDFAGVQGVDKMDGLSLRPGSGEHREHTAIYSMDFEQSPRFGRLATGTIAVIEEEWKYIHYVGYKNTEHFEDALYNLKTDPDENNNLAALQPVIAARMRAAIQEQLGSHGGPIP
jgi:arylsulfatase A-like enzyme